MIYGSSLSNLMKIRNCKRKRVSSWDKTGCNKDCLIIEPGEKRPIAEIKGSCIIRHIWITIGSKEEHYLRKILLRIYWDDEKHPSVEVPIGDFFGIGFGITKNFVSLPLQMSSEDGKAFNCWFPMPFYRNARIEIESECENEFHFFFYIDYEEYEKLENDLALFHAQWRRENPTEGWGDDKKWDIVNELWKVPNLDGKNNYIILDAEGKGHYVGCNLNIDCYEKQKNDWYGEGDDMIFIDGEKWPPDLHGTGTEDYFNTAWSPTQEYCAPYHGITVYSGDKGWKYSGKNSMYRFHIEDPVIFEKSIKITIEHGHANNLSNDYSSTAYWYQIEPHKKFPVILSMVKRLPR